MLNLFQHLKIKPKTLNQVQGNNMKFSTQEEYSLIIKNAEFISASQNLTKDPESSSG